METINRCLRSLKTHTSDSEKLAALMVISKVCQTKTINLEGEVILQLFEAITPTFLSRLLKTTPTVSTNNDFKVVGINILSFFARTKPEILLMDEKGEQLLNQVLDIFNPTKRSENRALYQDSFDILLGVVHLNSGVNFLLRNNVFTLLGDAILILEENENDLVEKAMSIFQLALHHHDKLNEDLLKYLHTISNLFMSNQELLKFHYLEITTRMVQLIMDCKLEIDYTKIDMVNSILKNISIACKDIMQSRIKAEVKRSLIVLICRLMKICGKVWIFDKQVVETVSKFIVLLLTVVSVELTLSFHSNNTENENNGFIESGIFITQHVLNYICSNEFEHHPLATDSSFISNVFNNFKNIVASVYDFLLNFNEGSDLDLENPILFSAVSMLSAWVTEETENLRDELQQVLPFLMRLGTKCLENIKQSNQAATFLDVMAPGILQIIPEKKMRTVLVSNKCHDIYVQYLSNSLAVECNSKLGIVENLFHMVHQFIILEPELCRKNSNFKNLSLRLLEFSSNLSHKYKLSNYCCLEIVAVTLSLTRMYESEYTKSLEQSIKVSVEITHKLSMNLDDSATEIWFIAIDNIIACCNMYRQLVKNIGNISYLEGWSSKPTVSGDMKEVINELLSLIHT